MTHSVHFDIRIDGNPAGFIEQLADFRQALEKQGIKTTGTGDQLTDKDRFAMGVFCQVLDKALCDSTDPELVQKLKRFAELPGEFTRAGVFVEGNKLVIHLEDYTWELKAVRTRGGT